ncbi:hypothetical protein BGZ80_010891 [Entomortierella chlamydospora]|uniref:Uncharacterized protein n=1 Tax=Entomortierella chlamydospora TaxID=101097 RepID=A0A9P6MV75_9FUNG|nr:hypothetical protein BGZ80_010891 [Entomortierella chlamydospora]
MAGAGTEDIQAALERNQNSLQDIEHMINSVSVSGVMNVFIVMETNKKGRCKSISRLVVFGAGETVNIS